MNRGTQTGLLRRTAILLVMLLLSLAMIGPALADISVGQMNLNFSGAPFEVHSDSNGNLWVSDYLAGEVWRVNAAGTSYTIYDMSSLNYSPGDAQLDSAGKVWFVDGTILRQMDATTGAISYWDIGTTTLGGLAIQSSNLIWMADSGSNLLYLANFITGKSCTYSLPDWADINPYPVIAGNYLWLADDLNDRLLRLDLTTPGWTYYPLPVGSSVVGIYAETGGTTWYTDKGQTELGRLNTSLNQLTRYPLPTGTDPHLVASAYGVVWYTEQSPPSLVMLDPAQNPATPVSVTPGTATTTASCRNLPHTDTAAATLSTGTPSWPYTDLTTSYNANGWIVYSLSAGSQPHGLAITDFGYAVDPINSVLIRFPPHGPTPVSLYDFAAASLPHAIQLSWRTSQEEDLLGFNLYRADSPDGLKQKLNPELIQAITPGQMQGNPYRYVDASPVTGQTYYYWVEWVGKGSTDSFGPVAVLLPHYLWLPGVHR